MFVVDTNLLVYAADEESPFHDRCRRLLEEWRPRTSPWYVTWGILFEFLRVTTHRRVFRSPWRVADAWRFVDAVLKSPALGVLSATERHAETAALVLAEMPHLAGNLLHDARTAVLMREHGVRTIYTHDADFHRFQFLETHDPIAERDLPA